MMYSEFHTLEPPNPHVSYPCPFFLTLEGPHENVKLDLFEGPHENAKLDLFEGSHENAKLDLFTGPTLGLQRYPPSPHHLTGK
jgi:hypothetical protein